MLSVEGLYMVGDMDCLGFWGFELSYGVRVGF